MSSRTTKEPKLLVLMLSRKYSSLTPLERYKHTTKLRNRRLKKRRKNLLYAIKEPKHIYNILCKAEERTEKVGNIGGYEYVVTILILGKSITYNNIAAAAITPAPIPTKALAAPFSVC